MIPDDPFQSVLVELSALHQKKHADYDPSGQMYGNIRASRDFGVSSVVGALIRLNDKVERLKTWAKTGKLTNEGVEDSLKDIANYAIIALILFREIDKR